MYQARTAVSSDNLFCSSQYPVHPLLHPDVARLGSDAISEYG